MRTAQVNQHSQTATLAPPQHLAEQMKSWLAMSLAAALLMVASAAQARPAPESFADLAEQLLPTVVNISSTTTRSEAPNSEFEDMFREFFERRGQEAPQRRQPRERQATSLGSGFIIDASGLIVTNNHVIEDADEITVVLHDDTEFEATLVGRDPSTDLAVLRIDPGEYQLKAASWGDSDALRIGDWMVAIGNPFGLGNTVTAGIVSAKSRRINSRGIYDQFIQTDASINRGNSGGPSFDLNGEVIGVNTAIFSPSGGSVGIGFAIPSSQADAVTKQLIENGRVRRGWLGVVFGEVDKATAQAVGLDEPRGAVVSSVVADSPAEQAGVEPGDVILQWGDKAIDESRDLPFAVAETPVDSEASVVVWRNGAEQTLTVVVGERSEEEVASMTVEDEPEEPSTNTALAEYGLALKKLTLDERKEADLAPSDPGVLVEDVDSGSGFARKGLRAGDIIAEVNDEAVQSPDEVLAIIERVAEEGFNIVALSVYRDGRYRWMAVELN